jgi:hypothetical protein
MTAVIDDGAAHEIARLDRDIARFTVLYKAGNRRMAAPLNRATHERKHWMKMGDQAAPGMVLKAVASFSSASLAEQLGLPTSTIPRGVEIPVGLLASCRNAQSLPSSGMLRWVPPGAPRPEPWIGPEQGTPTPLPDYIAELREAMLVHVRAGRSWVEAEDIIVSTQAGARLYQRAQKEFALRRGREVGPGRRPTSNFRAHLQGAA